MIGHTGFLLSTRRLADGTVAPVRRRRPAKGAYPVAADGAPPADDELWSGEALGERTISDKKLRRVRRDLAVSDPTGPQGERPASE